MRLIECGACMTALLLFGAASADAQVRATGYVEGTTVFPREAPSIVVPRMPVPRADAMPASARFSRVAPRIPYSPGTYTPGTYAPGSFAPGAYAPGSYAINSYTANSYAPNSYVPSTYTPGSYTPNSYRPGSYTPNTYLTARPITAP